jgi:type IV pilus assembly protein PilV
MFIQNNKGFTLLEALIGFLILSIGMLGIASLQAISLKAGKTSVYNSIALMKVEEIFESMRSNPASLAIYTGAGVNNACIGTANCTADQLAEYDVFLWEQNLKIGLPASVTSNVTVVAPVAPSRLATVNVSVGWSERNKDGTGSVNKTYAATTQICTGVPC